MKKKEIKERLSMFGSCDLEGDIFTLSTRLVDMLGASIINRYKRIELATESNWDGCGGYDEEFVLYGIREETDKELAKRQEKAKKARLASKKSKAKAKEKKEAKDKVEYERLKAKFEGGK